MSNWILKTIATCGAVSVALTAQVSRADQKQEIEQFLREFKQNPAKAMSKRPVKKDQHGHVVTQVQTAFSKQDVKDKSYIEKRDTIRQGLCKEVGGAEVCLKEIEPGRAPIGAEDRPEDLVDNADTMVKKLADMETLREAKLAESPWSDDYWGIYKGVLGARYTDRAFPASQDWSVNKKYVDAKTVISILNTPVRNSTSMDDLSPSEKYDLLVGDAGGTLTKVMWSEGEGYYRQSGKVETWMGICHGWSPAAYMLPRPTSMITVTAADGKTKLNFYPSDIKALGSLLWAKARTGSRFIGGRCNDKSPKTDANGRILSQDCFDNNPGAFHQVLVNQIGIVAQKPETKNRTLVMDATYDYEVWNQPVHGYSYTLFNPATNKAVDKLGDLKQFEIANVRNDKFKAYRSREAKYLVGVSMEVTYVVETRPSHEKTDSMERDALRTARYMYDLELNSAGEIIGGEWYTNAHPDFLWTPAPGTRAAAYGDRQIATKWDVKQALPADWSAPAARSSAYGTPLAAVVEALVTESRLAGGNP